MVQVLLFKPWLLLFYFLKEQSVLALKTQCSSQVEKGPASSCAKPQLVQQTILANHAHPLLLPSLASKRYTRICTLIYMTGNTLHVTAPKWRRGLQTLQQWCLPPFPKSGSTIKIAGNSVPSLPGAWCICYFFKFRGITNPKGQVLHEHIRTYSE